jgi:hypothetical protein
LLVSKEQDVALLSLGKNALKKWYIKQGFKALQEIFIPGTSTVKVYLMKKKL